MKRRVCGCRENSVMVRVRTHLVTASLMPRKTNNTPAVRLRMLMEPALFFMRSVSREEKKTRQKHQSVPVAMKLKPSTMNAKNFEGLSVAMN